MVTVVMLHLVSCKSSPGTVEVTETRELTQWDKPRTLIVPVMPPEWRQVPSTQFRVFNYRFGIDGEVYISNSKGGVLSNVNRWLKQYGKPDVANLDEFAKVKILEKEGILIEAAGRFGGGMGKLPRENAGLLGAIADFNGNLITVKMIGAAEDVAAEKSRFIEFCEALNHRVDVYPVTQ